MYYKLGRYVVEEDVVKVRDKKVIELYGLYVKLNFLINNCV